MDRQVQLQIAKPSINAGLKREILRILDENRNTVVRRAVVPEKAVLYIDPDEEVLNNAYAKFDVFFEFLQSQDF
jgi:hypothetical protein